ncbi:MAG: hypothetical protein COX79_00420 [Candidatus Levybacteria bacterium CG_4_10_14_0_2_um_filter_36_16]|nr:MAG: hypothetical protein AUK12_04330 [Candidatus Levybacteria bacterium CG2_30_37_29]PIR79528.1 MAG: hypothetical protein COU26_00650 [Candidatus Levybacteria bacterium CG10_big_fil_rev_8_21_14_0_10_36_30]PIZ97946.1 MAG: hypothetical protein COX79_00420 [Candidatus Levybacteria bacterium CG_4_10_14_0_2_um_filter_36_16]PJA90867.1 MAG: hypothetical protein CO136_00320 [Candidatus Levybacteria bacterium CG_4_9_14_3_um_filter_36_7]
MDDKKQGLTPELKQIYERVMNTPASSTPAPAAQPVVPPQTPPPVTTPPQAQQAAPLTPPPTIQTGPAPATNINITLPPSPSPRALNDTGTSKPFVFSSDVKKPGGSQPVDTNRAVMAKKEGKKLSVKIIILLVVVLIIVWGVFWAKFFKFF